MSEIIIPTTPTPTHQSPPGESRQLDPSSTFLTPADQFPSELADLDLMTVLALHGRVCRQLEREYLTDPDGADPATLDRVEELTEELDERQKYVTHFD
ncbi:MAG: hypothetical protein L0G85_07805 [Kocuria sp.]|nr:hypothetical protein [Kocuria sp.]